MLPLGTQTLCFSCLVCYVHLSSNLVHCPQQIRVILRVPFLALSLLTALSPLVISFMPINAISVCLAKDSDIFIFSSQLSSGIWTPNICNCLVPISTWSIESDLKINISKIELYLSRNCNNSNYNKNMLPISNSSNSSHMVKCSSQKLSSLSLRLYTNDNLNLVKLLLLQFTSKAANHMVKIR